MTISRNSIFQKLRFRLLVLIIIIQMMIIFGLIVDFSLIYSIKPYIRFYTSNTTVIRLVQHPDCHPFHSDITPQQLFQGYFSLFNDGSWSKRAISFAPSFHELHSLLFGSTTANIYKIWPNHWKRTVDLSYPYTALTESLFIDITKKVTIPITFIVEVGSFMGKSSIHIGQSMLKMKGSSKFVLLCIDTWLGGLEHWTDKKMRQMMNFDYGRPIVYEQFMANIIGNNLTDYVIPYSTTSILGARFLLQKKIFPQIIYLDSAHLQGETYLELELYWSILQNGGLLIGDDWRWVSVRCDVLRFTFNKNIEVTALDHIWFIKKN